MILIGVVNVALGYCAYTRPSDVHERIIPDVPGLAAPGLPVAPAQPVSCPPAIAARVAADLPGATITACSAERATVVRQGRRIDLELAGTDIVAVGEALTLPEIPAAVMRAFAVAYPRTIPSAAVKRTRRGAEPVYELAFPPGAGHALATLRGDGSIADVR